MPNDPLSLDKWYKAPFAQVHARRHYNFAGHVYTVPAPLDALLDDLRQYVDAHCSPQALFELTPSTFSARMTFGELARQLNVPIFKIFLTTQL